MVISHFGGVESASRCMQYTGEEDQAPEAGALSCFYWHHDKPAHIVAKVALNKSVLWGRKGAVWLTYSRALYDENGETISSSSNSLIRCAVTKDQNNTWVVTEVKNPA